MKALLKLNTNGLRMQENRKLAPKPVKLIRSKAAKSTYRNRAYKYNMLPNRITLIKKNEDFKKELKTYYKNKISHTNHVL